MLWLIDLIFLDLLASRWVQQSRLIIAYLLEGQLSQLEFYLGSPYMEVPYVRSFGVNRLMFQDALPMLAIHQSATCVIVVSLHRVSFTYL